MVLYNHFDHWNTMTIIVMVRLLLLQRFSDLELLLYRDACGKNFTLEETRPISWSLYIFQERNLISSSFINSPRCSLCASSWTRFTLQSFKAWAWQRALQHAHAYMGHVQFSTQGPVPLFPLSKVSHCLSGLIFFPVPFLP